MSPKFTDLVISVSELYIVSFKLTVLKGIKLVPVIQIALE